MAINKCFDWSELTRDSIIFHIMELKKTLANQHLSAQSIHLILSKHVKKLAPFKTKKVYSHKVDPGHVYIGGSYYSYLDQEKDKCIEICFCYFDEHTQIKLTTRYLKQTATLIADTILHEIMHMKQYRSRKFKSLPDYQSKADKSDVRKEQEYLGSTDEIDAYSFNIACELHTKFKGNYKAIAHYLNKNSKSNGYRYTWKIYLKAFEYDHNHPIIKKLKKKVWHYLPMAAIGKPYKTNEWINW